MHLPEKDKLKLHTKNANQTVLLGHIISRNALHDMAVIEVQFRVT